MYRELTEQETEQLESQGCRCHEWTSIEVAEDFTPLHIRNTYFEGRIRIGADCRIANVGIIRSTPEATFGEGVTISVLNEAGDGNIILYSDLTAQMAALMVRNATDTAVWEQLRRMVMQEIDITRQPCTTIGNGVSITDTREVTNVIIGDECEITGAARLSECTLKSTPEASILVSDGVICDNCIIQAGASVTDFAKLYDTFVGEACHIGRGFTSENSVFFANSHMDNGESCAALCGPFSVSHHKSTLLIGGEYSFYNAGSGTNFSNHAYKMGPIHWGTLMRGSKTASGAHTLWPAQVGTFSMLMGKIQCHPDTRSLPFSYLLAHGDCTYLVPGRNLTTVGTYRDIEKWPKRDRRPKNGRKSLVQYDWLNPLVIQQCIEGKQTLERLRREQGENVAAYQYNNTVIKNQALQKGIRYYDLAIRMAIYNALEEHSATLPHSTMGAGEWTDMLGMLAPKAEVESVVDDIRRGELTDISDVAAILEHIHNDYAEHKWAFVYRIILEYKGLDTLTEDDREALAQEFAGARQEWLNAIRYDAEREFELGDVDADMLNDFIGKIK